MIYVTIPDQFFDEERLERFRRRLPMYRQIEFFQGYDVVKAQYLLHLLKRQAEEIEVEPLARAYGFWPDQSFFFFRVDVQGAMSSRINLLRPLIGIYGMQYPLIDGLHRLYKAVRTGQLLLPCMYLSPEEARL